MKMLLPILCLVASVSIAAEKSATPSVSYTLLRSGSTVGTHASKQACVAARESQRQADAPAKTTGQTRYVCREDDAITVTYAPNAPTPAPVNCAVSDWSPWTVGSWSACVGGSQSRPEARTRNITVQPANGGIACPALSESRTVSQPCAGSATLRWTSPTQNTDGTSLTNLAGYRISYGTSATALAQTIQVPSPGASGYTVTNLAPGTWYFAVRAYTSTNESVSSNVGSKVVR